MTDEDDISEPTDVPERRDDPDGRGDGQHELAETTEDILGTVDPALEEHAYPVRPEEIASHYRGTEFELANETESWGSVFDRLEDEYDEFETADQARDAMLDEVQRLDAYDAAFTDEPRATDPEAPEPERVEAEAGEPGLPSEESVEESARSAEETTERPADEEAVEHDAERRDVDRRETE